jgi:hypothetical protein
MIRRPPTQFEVQEARLPVDGVQPRRELLLQLGACALGDLKGIDRSFRAQSIGMVTL